MLTAISEQGIYTENLKNAVEQGLKRIRKAKFQERQWAKAQCGRMKMAKRKANILAPKAEDNNQPG